MSFTEKEEQEILLYNQTELYLSAIGVLSHRCDPAEVEACRQDFPNLMRKDDNGDDVAHLDDYLAFLEFSTGISHGECVDYLSRSQIQFQDISSKIPVKRSPIESLTTQLKNVTGLELDEFSYKLFKLGDTGHLHSFLAHLASKGKGFKTLGKTLNDVRHYTRLNFPGLVSEDELVATSSGDYVMEWVSAGLFVPETTDAMMDFVVNNVSSSQHLTRLTALYRTDLNQPGDIRVVNICRDQEGKLRGKDYFKKTLGSFLMVLAQSALHFDDLDALKNLKSMSTVLDDAAIHKLARPIAAYYTIYAETHPEFDFKSRWLFKMYGNPIANYWSDIAQCKDLSSFRDIKSAENWSKVFRPELIRVAPADFINQLLTTVKVSTSNANRFIHEMHKAGLDCYQGFLLTTVGRFQYETQKQDPVDHDFMIRMCLADIQELGRVGFLASVPVERIISHPRKDEMLKPLYELTGEPRLLKAMNIKMLGKVFGQDLGI